MSAEAVLLALGTTMAKALFHSWLGRTTAADITTDLVDLIDLQLTGVMERRRARRLFERLAEQIAIKLEPFIAVEFEGLPDNERLAAIFAVDTALKKADLRDEVLLAADLDPSVLEQTLRQHVGDLAKASALSSQAVALYDVLLTETCAYLVELRTALPSYTSTAITELLRRETEVSELLEEVLRRLPAPLDIGRGGDPDAAFELKYRRRIAQQLDRLQLFGITVGEEVRRYALSVAYITLTARHMPATKDRPREKLDSLEPRARQSASTTRIFDDIAAEHEGVTDNVRVDTILREADAHLLRGEAGSGKTTLLQWLAVRSARREFADELSPWNETVPFFLQLRRYVGHDLPAPEHFLLHTARNLSEQMPRGWVHRVLESGRGLILIDGVDELPEPERPLARRWIEDLVADFPESRTVVTSRPPAVEDNWLSHIGFSLAELQPMELSDIHAFINHWHRAAAEPLGDDETEAVVRLGDRLATAVQDTPVLRSLATNPLLCAMLCALHRDRQTQLPADRLELYRIAIEMLLERRDVEREVAPASGFSLTLPQKEILLRDFAYWLMVNGRSDADADEVVRCFERRLPGLGLGSTATSSLIYRYLLERSGVLREPVEGRVDFVHRTFQEYLAAKEVVEQDSIDFLIERSHQDQWKEVVVLAAGYARMSERERLIRGLIHRGIVDDTRRHRLHLLAIACLETARELSPDLRSMLEELLQSLIPPTNISDARALSSAGDLAVPLLAQHSDARAVVAAACVRGLSLIGSADAMQALRVFSRDRRVTVTRELIRGWQQFDPETYAEQVLAECSLEYGSLTLRDTALVSSLHHLSRLKSLRVIVPRSCRSLEYLMPAAPIVVSLQADGGALEDFSALSNMPALQHVYIASNVRIKSLTFLAKSPAKSVVIRSCPNLSDISALSGIAVTSLRISGCRAVTDAGVVGTLANCSRLELKGTAIADIDFLDETTVPGLMWLDLSATQVSSLEALRGRYALEVLGLEDCSSLTSIEPLSELSHLRSLSLDGSVGIDDIASVSGCESLAMVSLAGLFRLRNIESLAKLRRLRFVDLSGTSCDSVGPLANLPFLESVYLGLTDQLWDLTPLTELPRLRRLHVANSGFLDWPFLLALSLSRVIVDGRCPRAIREELRRRGCSVLVVSTHPQLSAV